MYWIYDYASWVIGPLFVAIFIAVTWIGTFLTVVEFLRSVWDLARASRCRRLWIGAEVAIERGQVEASLSTMSPVHSWLHRDERANEMVVEASRRLQRE